MLPTDCQESYVFKKVYKGDGRVFRTTMVLPFSIRQVMVDLSF